MNYDQLIYTDYYDRKPKRRRRRRKKEVVSIRNMVNIIEKYNRTHKTQYTYGKFVALVNSGYIDISEVVR